MKTYSYLKGLVLSIGMVAVEIKHLIVTKFSVYPLIYHTLIRSKRVKVIVNVKETYIAHSDIRSLGEEEYLISIIMWAHGPQAHSVHVQLTLNDGTKHR